MDPGEQTTGTRDEHYNLISVLYHALHGAENADMYALDAEAVGDEEQVAFFREAQAMQMELAERAKEMLGIIEVIAEEEIIVEEGLTPGDMAGGMPPATGATTPGTEPLEDVPPTAETADVPPMADLPPEEIPPEDVPPRSTGMDTDIEPPPAGTTGVGSPEAGSMLRDEDVVAPDEAPMGDDAIGASEVPPTTDVPRTPEATAPGGAMPGAAAPGAAAPPDAVPREEDVVMPEEEVLPGDVAGGAVSDVPAETTVGRIEPEDLDMTIEALRGGAPNLAIETALAEIDGWEQRLEESGDPQLMPIAENLRQLRVQLTDEAANPAEIGRLLNTLGEQVQEVASGSLGEPVADELRQLGGLLNTEGREISGGAL